MEHWRTTKTKLEYQLRRLGYKKAVREPSSQYWMHPVFGGVRIGLRRYKRKVIVTLVPKRTREDVWLTDLDVALSWFSSCHNL